jgi:uncharacterized DUF497 family protein
MDENYKFNGIEFVWNKAKSKSNFQKHGITFEQATHVFFDPFFRLMEAGDKGEGREAVIGIDENWDILYVIHALYEGDKIRLISARKATRSERQYYEN